MVARIEMAIAYHLISWLLYAHHLVEEGDALGCQCVTICVIPHIGLEMVMWGTQTLLIKVVFDKPNTTSEDEDAQGTHLH